MKETPAKDQRTDSRSWEDKLGNNSKKKVSPEQDFGEAASQSKGNEALW